VANFINSDPIIVANNLTKEVNLKGSQLKILSNVSLNIKKSESVAIMGPSGAGKTTLIGLLAGLDVPTTGDVTLGGVEIFDLDEEQRTRIRGENVGFVFQSFYLLENLTALENVMLPLELHDNKEAKKLAADILEEVGLSDRVSHYPRQLSGGEQQRVAIARAFVTRPSILFADEPTGNLDQVTGDKIIESLFRMNKNFSTTLVMVTHEETLASKCDRIINLSKGGIY